jgi:hypothetical protein
VVAELLSGNALIKYARVFIILYQLCKLISYDRMTMNDKFGGMIKTLVMSYFKELQQYVLEELRTEKSV